MKTATTTRATHRGVDIFVMQDRIDNRTMFCCGNGHSDGRDLDEWFPTQGEAIARERQRIDRKLAGRGE